MATSEERIAQNEVLFREVNERIREVEKEPQLHILCECGDEDCTRLIGMTLEEYERLRADPVAFAVVPGHETASVEEVVARETYHVVRKRPGEQRLARRSDPRAGD